MYRRATMGRKCSLQGVALVLVLVLAVSLPGRAQFFWPWPFVGSVSEYLSPHNAARAQVGLPGLVWDNNVAAYAQRYANWRRGDCSLVHSDSEAAGLGENIFQGDGKDWKPADAVRYWVDERRYYDYYRNTCAGGQDCGHYTQVVWRGTTRVGCARVQCDGGGVFVTCNYSPPGNYIGQRPY